MLSGFTKTISADIFLESPARGGSTVISSGKTPSFMCFLRSVESPVKNSMFSIPLIFALTFASRMESGLISIPIKRLFGIVFAMASPIIPEPHYKSAQKLNRQFSAIEHTTSSSFSNAEVLTCLNASEEKRMSSPKILSSITDAPVFPQMKFTV